MVFVNYTNHKSDLWSDAQRTAAISYGSDEMRYQIVDVPFTEVDPNGDEVYINTLAESEMKKILAYEPIAVLCQGEMTLCFSIVQRLIKCDIPVLAACSRRDVSESLKPDKSTIKQSQFAFAQFRRYS